MAFPLGAWIDAHPECRHQLSSSGMRGTVPPVIPTAAEVRRADPEALRRRLAEDLGVDFESVFLTTGASRTH